MDEPTAPRILVIEDAEAIRVPVEAALATAGFSVRACADGAGLEAELARARPDLVVLDVMLPGRDGFELLRVVRRHSAAGVVMLTARDGVEDRLRGLGEGADDYVVKPFDVEEVFARLRALLRRTNGSSAFDEPKEEERIPTGQVSVAGLRMDVQARRAWRGERELELTRTEFDLLELLARNAGIVLDHATIYDRIWGYDFGPGSKNLAVYVGYLRRKLDEPGAPALIHTVRGVGYVLRED